MRDSDTLSGALGARGPGLTSQAHLFVVFQGSRPLAEPSRHRLGGIDTIELGRATEPDVSRHGTTLNLAIPDPWISSRHARLSRTAEGWVLEDLGSKNGTLVNGVLVEGVVPVQSTDWIEVGRCFLLLEERSLVFPRDPDDAMISELGAPLPELASFSAAFRTQLDMLARVAASEVPVLLLGETGTGKEVLAQAVHTLSKRRGDFVPVNVAALADTLIEAELFGTRKGAFSGASEDRVGLVRAADRGTLFLDEIGDLPASSQPAFLRVLQEHEVLPVGETRAVPVAFRLVAATHQGLERLVRDGVFREDLLARISGIKVNLPPLRERRTDLGMLVARTLARTTTEDSELTISALAGRALLRHTWPRNIRELVHVINAALALSEGGSIELEHLPPELAVVRSSSPAPARARATAAPAPDDTNDPRRATLIGLLEEHQGNISAVARAMGCARMQIHRWLKQYGLDPESFRAED